MKRVGLLGILLMLVMGLTFIPAQTTFAQEEGCVDYLDGNGPGDWELTPFGGPFPSHFGSYNATDDRFEGEYNAPADGKQNSILLTLDTPTTIASIEVDVDYDSTLSSVMTYFILTIEYDSVQQDTVISTTSPASDAITHLYDTPVSGVSEIYMNHTVFTNSGDGHTWITRIRVCFGDAPDGLTRPLADVDEHPQWGMFDMNYVNGLDDRYNSDFPYTVYAYSNKAEASVSAVAAGKVISITPFSQTDCPLITVSLYACRVVVPQPINQEVGQIAFSWEFGNIYEVRIRDAVDENTIYRYYLTKPTVQVGDDVVAGCIIGETIQLKNLGPFALVGAGIGISGPSMGFSFGLEFALRSLLVDAGVTVLIMEVEGVESSLFPALVIPPDSSNCKEHTLSACVNANPDLKNLNYYIHDPDIIPLEGGGANIPRFMYMLQNNIMIDPELDYVLTVQARIQSAGGDDDFATMNLQITSQVASYTVTDGWKNYTLTTEGDDWHEGDLVSIGVSNQQSSAASIDVRYICLAPVTASTAPGECYFANNEFDSNAAGWTISGTSFASGQAYMVHDATIQQPVLLKPDDESTPHTYAIRAQGRLLATASYTGQVDKSVSLQFQFPDSEAFVELGVIDSAAVIAEGLNPVTGAVEIDYPYTFSTTIEIEEDTSSIFTFLVEVSDADNYIRGMRLDYVCIDPEGDGTFPGQDPGPYDPPVIRGCSVVPVPLEGSVAAWTFYHWSNLKRFFNCDLMPLLKNWFKLFDSFRRTMLGVSRYWIALVHHGSNWTVSVFYWFNGHFSNIAQGRITTVFSSGNGCNGDILCNIGGIIDTLANTLKPIVESLANAVNTLVSVIAGVFIGVVNLFFTLIGGLVSVVVAIIIRLMRFVGSIVSLLTGLVGAFNGATPTAIPGLPTCATDPSSNLLCMGVWFADNTIFAGRWNTIFIVIYSIWSILLILYIIGEIKDTLLKTWGSS